MKLPSKCYHENYKMKDISENYHALFDYYLEVRSEYYTLLGKIKKIKTKKAKSDIQGRIDRLKKVMKLNKEQLIDLDEQIVYYASNIDECPCINRWIEFNDQEKEYRSKLRLEKNKNEGLIQNSYIRESIIKKLIEQKDYEKK